jgi:hypothetical protein
MPSATIKSNWQCRYAKCHDAGANIQTSYYSTVKITFLKDLPFPGILKWSPEKSGKKCERCLKFFSFFFSRFNKQMFFTGSEDVAVSRFRGVW